MDEIGEIYISEAKGKYQKKISINMQLDTLCSVTRVVMIMYHKRGTDDETKRMGSCIQLCKLTKTLWANNTLHQVFYQASSNPINLRVSLNANHSVRPYSHLHEWMCVAYWHFCSFAWTKPWFGLIRKEKSFVVRNPWSGQWLCFWCVRYKSCMSSIAIESAWWPVSKL